ncbi:MULTISPECIES: EF-hand domain-containing protein [unclassified Streptomyces]|uniref:EF-hand domain-containing protein n=1 Tax=unclassified Streptomyces TaxID=2593676 RepID=UPI00225BEA7C|nr:MULTISPECIES: EF-hand domain-containing protein [unclassified Streptomyces]MCX4527120.1 EF-hand domain-containing protein [Streptomyces sp. NBC_01551]MCX4542304.1 EF-hand domain-containing protein [Streptomyces sp. NBC_01565]
MTNDVLDRKLSRAFAHFDTDGSGHLESQDFVDLGSRMLAAFGEPATSPKGTAVMSGLVDFWTALSAELDRAKDGRIDLAEYQQGMRRLYVEGKAYDTTFRPLAQAVVELIDTDGDGTVSRQEFHTAQRVFDGGLGEAAAQEAFARIDSDGDGQLTVDEFETAIREYYTDPSDQAAGNVLFGRL